MRDDVWPYKVDREDPLTEVRIPVASCYPDRHYLLVFDKESEVRPDPVEVELLVSYNAFQREWYNEHWRERLLSKPFDMDGGYNSVTFHKWAPDDWGYRRSTFNLGWFFTVPDPYRTDRDPHTLLRLLDRIHHVGTDYSRQDWQDWKKDHPEVFGREAR